MIRSLPSPLRGIVPPLVTPLLDNDRLDAEGLERLIEHVLAGGVHGLFILGTSGEATCLSYRLRHELITRVCRQVGSRVPVLVGVTDTSLTESLALALSAAEAGAAAVVTAPPYYYSLTQPELARYMRALATELPLPLLLYNMPTMTKTVLEPETVQQLLDVPGIVGLKDSSRDKNYFNTIRHITRQRPDWALLVGFEHMLVDAIRAGGDGGVLAGANLFPRVLVDLYDAALADDEQRIERIEKRLVLQRRIYALGQGATASLQGIKCGLSLFGICQARMAHPFTGLTDAQCSQVAAILNEINALGE
jgi:2-dehydro-3-deoxy-D-pentonate aldolase